MGAAGHVLSELRRSKRLSQLELSLQADVSARHISFIENGRTRPSRELLVRLSQAMGLSYRDCNRLMVAGGYTPAFSDMTLDDHDMQPVRQALQMILDNHDPFPAAVLSSRWDLLMGNSSLNRLMTLLLPARQHEQQPNLLEMIFDAQALRPFITNWNSVASLLLRRLRLQAQATPHTGLDRLMQQLLSMDPPQDWQSKTPESWEGPILTTQLSVGGQSLSVLSTVSTLGTTLDAGLQELMIENYYPADAATREFLQNLQDAGG